MKKKNVILILLFVLLIVSVGGIFWYLHRQQEDKDINETLKELAAKEQSDEDQKDKKGEEEGEGSDGNNGKNFVSPINFEALKQENEDIYAWICIDDTVIDYPVLQSATDDPDYYVDYTVERVKGYPGALFTESDLNTDPFEDMVTVIYGHDMKNGTMFGTLNKWTDDEYRNAHDVIRIYTEAHTYTYNIAFVQVYDDRNILAKYDCSLETDYQAFLDSLENVHAIPYWHSQEIETDTNTPLIVLSTCYGDDRLLVGAVLTEKE